MERLPKGWKQLSVEDRGLLLTLLFGSPATQWKTSDLASNLDVSFDRANLFLSAAIDADVLNLNNGIATLVACSEDLRKSWERRFEEVFWPSVTSPWKKLGRANALKVWRSSVFSQIKPKTEEAADALLQEIMQGVERYKQLLIQPNAPSMKYPEGWLSGQRWRDEIDDRFIEKHASIQAPQTLSPLERARRQQEEGSRVVAPVVVVTPAPIKQLPPVQPERRIENALPEFNVSL